MAFAALTFFQQDQRFNNTFTNDIVSFEQLGPDIYFSPTKNILLVNINPSPAEPRYGGLNGWYQKLQMITILVLKSVISNASITEFFFIFGALNSTVHHKNQ